MNFYEQLFNKYDINKTITGLTNELRAIYIYNIFKNSNNSILYVTSSLYESNKFYQMFRNYTDDVLLFSMDDFLTSEALAISPELKISRLETINSLLQNNKKIVITNLMGFRRYLPSKELYKSKQIKLTKKNDYDLSKLTKNLIDLGYERETIVSKTGELGIRGYVLDIFPVEEENPIRIEFWGDTIDTIKYFDIDNQRTTKEINEIVINPNTEFLTEQEVDILEQKQKNLAKYTKVNSIKDYLLNPIIVFNDYSQMLVSNSLIDEEIFNYNISIEQPSNTKYMLDFDDIKNKDYIYFEDMNDSKNMIKYNSLNIINFSSKLEDINKQLNNYIKSKRTVIICLSNIYEINKLESFLDNKNIVRTTKDNILKNKINLIIQNLYEGFEFNEYIVLSKKEIFNQTDNSTKYKTKFKLGSKIRDITKLELGDYIVHSLYGIGRYLGIKTLIKNGLKKDYIQLEYKGSDKLYIPVEKIDLISKYSSKEGFIPHINSLNTSEWEKTKLKARKRIESIAKDLLKLYAEREASKGFKFLPDSKEQIEFEKEFPYNETKDQIRVTDEIKKDMESEKPMDRLLCGDVGYGKTEVAFRAIFKAVYSSKQVVLLCPTTILSNQHYKNALERFKNYAVNIKLLNRFVTTKETNKTLKELKEGKVDVLIGTHRVLSDDVEFKDLGLLIIDEEQRFGVKHKEKIKQYKNTVDVLTLSATPIPRTLQMSMAGIRSLSLIETPPINRYPVQTYVLSYNKQIIKDAIYKEISRNGQVFILYNSIDDMEIKKQEISEIVPDAKIVYAHGKMDKSTIEDVMIKFINKEYDILLCTTIIETGIDIPNVNTLIIIDADHFGLSQLYQIRGRVGRSEKIAYCYLMYDNHKILSELAVKRLKVIKDFTELGSGFSIAMRDLSIRGAGDFLGSEQSGFIDSVGIDLFMQMLNEQINKEKGIETKNEDDSSEPLIDVETTINDKYVDDIDLKIYIHKKINEIDSYDKMDEVKQELEDRFGKIDEQIDIYMHEELFEKMAKNLNITKMKQTKNFVEITLPKELSLKIKIDDLFMKLVNYRFFRFSSRFNQIIITLDTIKLDKHFIYYLIDLLEVINSSIKE